MFDSEILEVAIGMVFIFLVASLTATAVREMIESVLKTRAIQLERGLRQMLDDPTGKTITKDLFDHPLLYGLFAGDYQPGNQLEVLWRSRRLPFTKAAADDASRPRRIGFNSSLPAYIPSRNFAMALLHVASGEGPLSLEAVKATAMTLPAGRLRSALLVALGEAQGDIDRARTSLEAWFDGTMDRVSGWYKRETQWILFVLGLFLAVALNINTLTILHDLTQNNRVREDLVARIHDSYKDFDPAAKPGAGQVQGELNDLSALIGWSRFDAWIDRRLLINAAKLPLKAGRLPDLKDDAARKAWIDANTPSPDALWWRHLLGSLPGWLITALAVSLGAPFWFDLLNKIMVIRSTVKPYEKSPSEGSEDRRGGVPAAERLEPRAGNPGAGVGPRAAGPGLPPGPPAPPVANLRLAVLDRDTLTDLSLTRDGEPIEVPADGFVELPLTVGVSQALAATATRAGAPVAWSQTFVPSLDDERDPVDANLTPAPPGPPGPARTAASRGPKAKADPGNAP